MQSFDHSLINRRISRPEMFCKKSVHRNFAKFTEKHLCQSLFFNKVTGLSLSYRTPPVPIGLLLNLLGVFFMIFCDEFLFSSCLQYPLKV